MKKPWADERVWHKTAAPEKVGIVTLYYSEFLLLLEEKRSKSSEDASVKCSLRGSWSSLTGRSRSEGLEAKQSPHSAFEQPPDLSVGAFCPWES